MKLKHMKSLNFLWIAGLGLTVCGIGFLGAGSKMSAEKARLVGEAALHPEGRATAPGSLLSGVDPDLSIAKARNRTASRSPAYEPDASMDVDFAVLGKEFLARDSLRGEEEKLKEFFPSGKGVNRSIRLSLLLASRGTDSPNAFSEIQLANRVQAEILAHGESAVVSLNSGLASLPKEMVRERQAAIRLLSTIAAQQPELRSEVKTSLLAEASRSGNSPSAALALVALLRVNPSKEWFQEVNHAYERLNPGSDLSEVVALNVVAL